MDARRATFSAYAQPRGRSTGEQTALPGVTTAYLMGGGYLIGATGSHFARLHLTDLPDLHC